MRVENVLGSALECVPCARVSNQIIVYTSPNYRNKINSATHSESLQWWVEKSKCMHCHGAVGHD